MVDLTAAAVTVPEVFETVRSLILSASYVLGGLVGATLILILVRWWQNRILIRLLKDIKYNLDQQNKKLKIAHSKTLFESKIYHTIKTVFEKAK